MQVANVTAAVSATAASVAVGSWLTDHAIYFTVGAAVAAILSGVAATFFYCVQTYYKIKAEHIPK